MKLALKLAAKASFAEFDADSSGMISLTELRQALGRMGIKLMASEVASIMAIYDTDGSGELDETEFLGLVNALDAGTIDLKGATSAEKATRAPLAGQASAANDGENNAENLGDGGNTAGANDELKKLRSEVARLTKENEALVEKCKQLEAAAACGNKEDATPKEADVTMANKEEGAPPKAPPPGAKKKVARKPEARIARTPQKRASPMEAPAADPSKWVFSEQIFSGASSFTAIGQKEEVSGVITEGIAKFKANPSTFIAIMYQTSMLEWPADQQIYTLLHRKGTKGYRPTGVGPDGWMTILMAQYQALPPLEDLGSAKDGFTEQLAYEGFLLHHEANRPLCPGRGDGIADVPSLKIIGDVDPSDIAQGGVGDCWLLSGISSLAEFDGAVKRLFRKTPNLDQMPSAESNSYTVTLWDLPTWSEVDVVVDERLARKADGSGLLGAAPSKDGELWVAYLEKAVAVHCGGFDKINGGQCTHAWALLTGCKAQYTIRRNDATGKYGCFSFFNPNEGRHEALANSPHDGFQGLWPMAWPEVGGGGALGTEIGLEDLFEKMCAWDDQNYILAAGTKAGSDTQTSSGIVDGHAYSVLRCVNDAAGVEGCDLIQIRNPWGRGGELEGGQWADGGPGWASHPQVKESLRPVQADDGIFWASKAEFAQHYPTLYLSASNMSAFLEESAAPTGGGGTEYAANYTRT